MPNPPRVTKRSKVALTGDALERAVARIAVTDPGLVAVEHDGKPIPGYLPAGMLRGLVPSAPLKTGATPSIDPQELPREWADALAVLRRNTRGRVTLAAMATRLGISPETAKRYRKKYGLPL